MLFDGPVGEEAWLEDGSVGPPLMALGEEEILLLQKVQEVIRVNPGKAESLVEKFHQILKEESKVNLICNHCPPVLNNHYGWDGNQMRLSLPPSPDIGNVKRLHKRGVPLKRKVVKKKKVSEKKKDRRNVNSRKVERKQSGMENPSRTKKLGKKEKQKENKMKTKKISQKKKKKKRKTKTKIKKTLKMKKTEQQRKAKQGNGKRTKHVGKMDKLNNNCTSLWAKLTNVGLGMASTLQKQVIDIDLDIKVISLTGKFHIEE